MAYEGRLARAIQIADTTKFWTIVCATATIAIFVYAFVSNRAQINRNAQIIRAHNHVVAQQRQALVFLCSTVHLLDFGYIEQSRIARQVIGDPKTPMAVRMRWVERLRVYNLLHDQLSDARPCRQIE